ncbi:MAG: exodeoxyribonuclease III [Bacteroidetes bacterium]|nr:exodeoxyribonuclease III [Bacteroidota bacterium]
MKIATWNVNGIRAREAQVSALLDEQPDVLCLQELKAAREQVPQSLAGRDDYWSYWHGTGGYSGVSIHFRKAAFPSEPAYSHPAFDMETRIAQAVVGDTAFTSVYIPNGGKDYAAKLAFMREMEGYVAGVHAAGLKLVLCGDMNVALTDMDIHPSQNKPGIIGTSPEERALLSAIIGPDLVDVGRRLDPENNRLFTWWPPWKVARQRNLGWRIDYIFASQSLAAHATECRVLKDVGTSDHAPVTATFAI